MEQTTQFDFSQVRDRKKVLKTVAEGLAAKLREDYGDIQVCIDVNCWAPAFPTPNVRAVGYSIQEVTELAIPVEKRRLFGLVKRIETHETRELAYLNIEPWDTNLLYVRVNERAVIGACEEVAKRTGGNVSVEYTF